MLGTLYLTTINSELVTFSKNLLKEMKGNTSIFNFLQKKKNESFVF